MTEARLINHKLRCPGCGHSTTIQIPPDKKQIECQCPQCFTKWSVTLKTGEEDMQRNYFLAKDYD